MTKVIVIGGGASGMISAGRAAECGAEVILIEKNKNLGKKLSITGKGRCNITNTADLDDFINSFGKNGKFLYSIFSRFFRNELIDLLSKYKVQTKIERGGRVFTNSDDASDVVNALKTYLIENNVKIITSARAKDIVVDKNEVKGVVIEKLPNNKELYYSADKVILATGGLSYPGTGSTGDGYKLAEKLGHTIVPLKPALVPLIADIKLPSDLKLTEDCKNLIKKLEGLSLKNVLLTVFQDNKKKEQIFGEMLFTNDGVSGPIVLSISKKVGELLEYPSTTLNKGETKGVELSINFKPALSFEQLEKRLLRDISIHPTKKYSNFLKLLLPQKAIFVFVKLTGIDENKEVNQLTKEERRKLLQLLTDFRLTVIRTDSIKSAIITSGGVSLSEVNHKTLESKIIKGLYFCGEILDLDAPTGGYNLQCAFSTGYIAGESSVLEK